MSPLNRRRFVAGAAIASAASYSRVLGANERIRVGAVGTGGRCQYLMDLFNKSGAEIAAVCDVYDQRRQEAKAKLAPDAREYGDYRQVLDRNDIDAVVIGTPDHWHVPITTAAVRAGKDVYCEKPVTHTIEEGEPLIAAVRQAKRVVQTGTQQRSWEHYIAAKDVIASGKLGKVTFVRTYWYQNHIPSMAEASAHPEISGLDWKMFLGSASDRPFDADQYFNWRWYWDFGGGAMTDLFVHWVDVAHWFTGEDTPSRATATGVRAILKRRETPDTMSAALSYASTVVEFDSALLGYIEGGGIMFRGPKGAMRLHRSGFTVYAEMPRYSENYEPDNPIMTMRSTADGTLAHVQNFLDCVRSRKDPNAPVEAGVAAARAGHAANFALRGNGVWTGGS